MKIEQEFEIPDRLGYLVASLPKNWTREEREKFLAYFTTILDELYPVKNDNPSL